MNKSLETTKLDQSSSASKRAPEVEFDGRSLLYLAAVYAGLQGFLWVALSGKNTPLAIVGAIAILAVMIVDPWRRGETLATLGLDGKSLKRALRLIAMPILLVVLGVVALIAWQPLCLPIAPALLKKFVVIIPWALFQQGIIQATFNKRLSKILGSGWIAATITAVCFALMHLPGPVLTAMTFVGGLAWSRYYQKTSNLWAIVLTHALLSAVLQSFLPPDLTHGFRVGPGYYRY